MKKTVVAASVLFLTVLVVSALAEGRRDPHQCGHVWAYVDKPMYRADEVITLGLYNGTRKDITLPNSAPWQIIEMATGQVVSTHFAAQDLVTVGAGEHKEWTAGKPEFDRKPGAAYAIVFTYIGSDGKLDTVRVCFMIRRR